MRSPSSERKRKVRKIQEDGLECSDVALEEDVTATGPLQQSAGSVSCVSDESGDEDVLVSEWEVVESAFGKLMASAVEQSRCSAQQRTIDQAVILGRAAALAKSLGQRGIIGA